MQGMFFYCFKNEIHETIIRGELFKRDDLVAVGASGGKGIINFYQFSDYHVSSEVNSNSILMLKISVNSLFWNLLHYEMKF
jgi:hypothetical protein